MSKLLLEAVTVKARAQAAAKALKILLADKTLPEELRTAAEGLHSALKKKWSDLEQQAGATESAAPQVGETSLEESPNLGDWVYARMHTDMVMRVDNMLADDRLTYAEYAAALEAVSLAVSTFRAVLSQQAPEIFARNPWSNATPEPVGVQSSESGAVQPDGELVGDAVELLEKAVRRDGTIPIKIIQPGWGTTGYYPAAVLERDGPKVFPRGTHMYWDHPTQREDAERPERELDDLAAVLTSDARWQANGPKGPGLYADAQVMEHYRTKVDELAHHIGVSIRAFGTAKAGEADGRSGPVIDALTSGRSIDFVTAAGAGGEILTLFESARKPVAVSATSAPEKSGDGGVVSNSKPFKEEVAMSEKELQEANALLQAQLDEAKAVGARALEALILREAKDQVGLALGEIDLPAVTKSRLKESLAKNAPVKDGALDGDAFKTLIAEAVNAEVKYLTEAAGLGRIRGMGGKDESETEEVSAREAVTELESAFVTLGLSESAAKSAARGRE